MKLSQVSKIFLSKIAKYMQDGVSNATSVKQSDIYTSESNALPSGTKFHLITSKIRESILSTKWIGQTLTISIGDREISVFLIHPCVSIVKEMKRVQQFFSTVYEPIYAWLYTATQFADTPCSKSISIYIYFTDFKKELPESSTVSNASVSNAYSSNAYSSNIPVIDEVNVNTGYTYSCRLTANGDNQMYIYRKEEWFKVFIHECFHAFNLDYLAFSNAELEKFDKEIIDIIHLHVDIRFYETYCELWAEVLQIVFLCRQDILLEKWNKIEKMLKIDCKFSIQQSKKLLRFSSMDFSDLFIDSPSSQLKRVRYRENTPVTSYYFLKTIFYSDVNRYIEWTSKTNGGSLDFFKSDTAVYSYIQLFKEIYPRVYPSFASILPDKSRSLRMSFWEL